MGVRPERLLAVEAERLPRFSLAPGVRGEGSKASAVIGDKFVDAVRGGTGEMENAHSEWSNARSLARRTPQENSCIGGLYGMRGLYPVCM